MTIFLRYGGRCFVVDSEERGQLGQAVKGLSVAVRSVNKDAEGHGREAVKEKKGKCCPCCLIQLGSLDMADQVVPRMGSDLCVQHLCLCRKQSPRSGTERKAEIEPSCSQYMGRSTVN